MINDKYINEYLWCNTGIKSRTLYKIEHDINCEEYKYLINRYTDSRSLKESVYRIKYNIENIPKCPVCGKLNNFIGGKEGYTKHCCCTCAQLDKNVREKNKQTNLKLYGVENGAQSKLSKEKYIKHIQEKYNDNTITNAFQAKEVIEKIKQTCLNKYGVTNYALLPGHQAKLKSQETILKRNNTKRLNHTFNTSQTENDSYKLLKNIFNVVKRNYKSKEYPFLCDFYIEDINTYIECNYHWTHGGHPYSNSNEDNKLVKLWKNKNTRYYECAIYVWTVRDVNKRNIAKQNNLNYIEFWNINELKNWINNNYINI
jgi:ATP-dependent Lon protease